MLSLSEREVGAVGGKEASISASGLRRSETLSLLHVQDTKQRISITIWKQSLSGSLQILRAFL